MTVCYIVSLKEVDLEEEKVVSRKGFYKLEDALNFAQDCVIQQTKDEEQLNYIINASFKKTMFSSDDDRDFEIELFDVEIVS